MFNSQQIQSLTEENERLKADINRLYGTMTEYESWTQEKMRELERTIQTLQERLNQSDLINPRGAGRKSRITDDVLSCIKDLRQKGLSFSKIAAELTETTGTEWSKSTVAYALKSSEN